MEPLKPLINISPIVRQTPTESVFGGYGQSHFSHVQDHGFHVTTQIPGIGPSMGFDRGFSIHDPVRPMFDPFKPPGP